MDTNLKISEAAALALHTMVVLAGNANKVLTTKDIASLLSVSEAHLSKVLQRLATVGLVRSVRGPKGGFMLGKAAPGIALLHIYECIDGRLPSGKCLLSPRTCAANKCILGGLLTTVNKEVRDYLGETKLSDLTDIYPGKVVKGRKATKRKRKAQR